MSNHERLSSFPFKSGKNFLHCSIAPKRENNNEDQVRIEIPEDNPRGFDQLREMGFDINDIREIREQFYVTSRSRLRPNMTRNELFQMEEDFLRSAVSQSEIESAQENRERQERETGRHLIFLFFLFHLFIFFHFFLFKFEKNPFQKSFFFELFSLLYFSFSL